MAEIAFNAAYKEALNTKCRYIHMLGGRAGGRSHAVADIFILKLLGKAYFRGVIARQSLDSVRDSQFQHIVDIINKAEIRSLFDIQESTMRIKCLATGNTIIPKGFRTSKSTSTAKMKSLTGVTDVWIEEADEVQYEDFLKLDHSLRTVEGSGLRIFFTYNTEKGDHWLKTKHHDHADDRMLFIHTTYTDNRVNLDDDFIQALEKLRQTDPEYARVWIDGEWGGGVKGRIYEHFKETDKTPEGETVYGIDFGYNNPTSIVKVVNSDGVFYVYEYLYQSKLTNNDLIEHLRGISKSDYIYADNAEPARIEEIKRAGYNVYPANKDVKYGISRVKASDIRLHYSAKNILKESKSYQWKQSADGSPLEEPVKMFDHAMDALRYAIVGMTDKVQGPIQVIKYKDRVK